MVRVQYGGKNGQAYDLELSDDYLVVRTTNRKAIMNERPYEVASISPQARTVLSQYQLSTRFRDAGVEILRARIPQSDATLRDDARRILNNESAIQFAGRVLVNPQTQTPFIYTENFFVKFEDDEDVFDCQAVLQRYNLTIKRQLDYVRNAYFVSAIPSTGLTIFDIASDLLQEEAVELCHPELISEVRSRQAFPQQWHLKSTTIANQPINAHAHVEAAWSLSTGSGTTIAIIDDGVDIDHDELRGKIVAPRDVTRKSDDPRPGRGEDHGTACAGVACGNGNFGASGTAPAAKLIPVRLASGLGSQAEADAFVWAARNGADVISCSWGPADGAWWDPNDPTHNQVVPLPDSTRLAIDFATTQGRNGKGCLICFAAGNGNESVDNDGYASYAKVMAVAACNDTSRRSAYSDYGKAVWCAFPSNDVQEGTLTSGIWTTDRTGSAGYNPGADSKGDAKGNYTNSFGGTSSACPGAAGVAALIIARNPDLRWDEVRDIIKRACDKIDLTGGNYDSEGRSPYYGYGRINARKAVELAVPPQPTPSKIYKAVQDIPVNDFETATIALTVPDKEAIKSIKVTLDIEHPYIGDLMVTLKPPADLKITPLVLHKYTGGGSDNIKTTYDTVNAPDLKNLQGKSAAGNWLLEVWDNAASDTGMIRSLTLEIGY
jgi:subtilisin family serine protease